MIILKTNNKEYTTLNKNITIKIQKRGIGKKVAEDAVKNALETVKKSSDATCIGAGCSSTRPLMPKIGFNVPPKSTTQEANASSTSNPAPKKCVDLDRQQKPVKFTSNHVNHNINKTTPMEKFIENFNVIDVRESKNITTAINIPLKTTKKEISTFSSEPSGALLPISTINVVENVTNNISLFQGEFVDEFAILAPPPLPPKPFIAPISDSIKNKSLSEQIKENYEEREKKNVEIQETFNKLENDHNKKNKVKPTQYNNLNKSIV